MGHSSTATQLSMRDIGLKIKGVDGDECTMTMESYTRESGWRTNITDRGRFNLVRTMTRLQFANPKYFVVLQQNTLL